MRKYILSPFPYYGGKNRMAGLIVDMLNYRDTSIYIEPFGGACRTLLNKPYHQSEVYYDTGIGLCTFFRIVQNEETCTKLQELLLRTEPSEYEFWKSLKYKANAEKKLLRITTDSLKKYISRIKRNATNVNSINAVRQLRRAILNLDIQGIIDGIMELEPWVDQQERNVLEESLEVYQRFWDIGEELYWDVYEKGREQAEKELKEESGTVTEKQARIEKAGRVSAFEAVENLEEPMEFDLDEKIQLAAATFETFYFSRDGMGLSYSENRGENIRAYCKKIEELGEIGHRMRNVKIFNSDACFLLDKELQKENSYLMNPNVMMYLDPSYLSVEDVETGRKGGKNLGSSYDSSFGLREHKKLLDNIIGAKAKILLSNYDVEPYKSRLTEEKGWHRYEYETKTSVGGTKNNKRVEVLWYNY